MPATGKKPTQAQIDTMVTLLHGNDDEDEVIMSEFSIDEVLMESVFVHMDDKQIVSQLPAAWVEKCIAYMRAEKQAQV